ncbi:hypothetical protein TNCV_331431 [Trichonephila clavipes]|nr:hypothetical protein TNCV_331431 [Trichonephila clavipes]
MAVFYGFNPCCFYDDSARCHVERSTMDCYGDNGVNRTDWPDRSLELNTIESLWKKFQTDSCPKSVKELTCILQAESGKGEILLGVTQGLVKSMSRRAAAVMTSCWGLYQLLIAGTLAQLKRKCTTEERVLRRHFSVTFLSFKRRCTKESSAETEIQNPHVD